MTGLFTAATAREAAWAWADDPTEATGIARALVEAQIAALVHIEGLVASNHVYGYQSNFATLRAVLKELSSKEKK